MTKFKAHWNLLTAYEAIVEADNEKEAWRLVLEEPDEGASIHREVQMFEIEGLK